MTNDISQDLWNAGEPSPSTPQPPMLDGLRVIRLLGAGGGGAVWLCEQQGPLVRQVAVKVMRSVLAGPRLRERFESERRLLARLDHPGIAKIFDAGESQDGALYFIMELVQGDPLVDWCDQHRLTIEARLALMRQVASAIQHAHSKGIIHLDLKSSNILVREVDGAPVVKVIDFGIARLTEDADAVMTSHGDGAHVVGTLEYMAPEQLTGTRQLDTRADIYSLGVVLYRVLTGLMPFDSRLMKSSGTVEAQRVIRECEAPAPSDRVRQAHGVDLASASERAACRQLTTSQLVRAIQGQLDAVVLRCLHKQVNDRYASCDALSADIERWLNFEPVLARQASQRVRLSKFARRNRVSLTVAAVVASGLIAGTIMMAYGLAQAKRELARAERLHAFNTQMMTAVTPEVAKGMDTRLLRLIFDQSMGEIETRYGDDPILAADAHGTASMAYRSIGEYAKALEHIERKAVAIEAAYSVDDARVLDVRNEIACVLLMNGRVDQAAPIFEDVLARRRVALGENDSATLASLHNLAWLRDEQSRLKDSQEIYLDAAVRKRIVLGIEHESTLRTLDNLAEVQRRLGKLAEARAVLEETIAVRTRLFSAQAPDTLLARNNLAMVTKSQGDLAFAEGLFGEIVSDMDRIFGSDHPYTLIAQNNLASIYRDTKRLTEAQAIYEAIIPAFERRYGSDAKTTLVARSNLGLTLEKQGQHSQAEAIYIDIITRKRRALGDKAESTLNSLHNLAFLYTNSMNRPIDAIPFWREAATGYKEVFGERSPKAAGSAISLARLLVDQGQSKDAEALVQMYATDESIELPAAMRLVATTTHGRALAQLGDIAGGMVWLAKSYELAKKAGDEKEARDIAGKLADIALDAGDAESADKWTQARQSPAPN